MTRFSDLIHARATREEALDRLHRFIPHAGADYAQWRNHDFGPEGDNRVSALSPWLRHRLISEQEVITAVLAQHEMDSAEKFIQEVCWRSYWKGYLERRPEHWAEYRQQVERDRDALARDRSLTQALQRATAGDTGIDAFDAWVGELTNNGYLHNHARMWFASIWVFTLELPWSLGADFFLRHLLDGDPASNTLSWRWVTGLHTQGKAYLARSGNIARYTDGRFNPGDQLANEAPCPPRLDKPPLLESPQPVDWHIDQQTALLITEDDLTPETLFGQADWAMALAVQITDGRSDYPVAETVRQFARDGLTDALDRNPAAQSLGPVILDGAEAADGLALQLKDAGITQVLTPWVPVGPGADALNWLKPALKSHNIRLQRIPRDWDTELWPAATHGFFRFWKAARPVIDEAFAT